MYTNIQNVAIIVALLKKHGIRRLVLSAGTRHVPLAHSVENDSFFICYSVVDERSAAYYALGISKETGEPVAVACTSSTATCNYVPAVAEAYYQHIPLLILTGDRDPYLLDQLEDQMINQVNMYVNFCRKSVTLPVVTNEREAVYCQRLVNEALLELRHREGGPVHINFPINQSIEQIADASAPELPAVKPIYRICREDADEKWREKAEQLRSAKRILVICGSGLPATAEERLAVESFFEKFNCVFAVEPLSNLNANGCVNTYLLGEAITGEVVRTEIRPDLIIFFGNNYVSRWKAMLKYKKDLCQSWQITRDGDIKDPFMNLECVFECSPAFFFRRMAQEAGDSKNNYAIYKKVYAMAESVQLPDDQEIIRTVNNDRKAGDQIRDDYLSAFRALRILTSRIPPKSLLHLSILNSTRISQMFRLPEGVSVYSNIGTDGIDGSMSTFLGQAQAAEEKPCFLVIGDLSFFYDMNSISIRNIGKNVHILLINNGGGAEFYFSMGPKLLPNIDRHISAAHHHTAKAWVESNGFRYLTARNAGEFEAGVDEFVREGQGPVLMEIFTDKLNDVTILKTFRRMIQLKTGAASLAEKMEKVPIVSHVLQTETGKNIKEKVKSGFRKFF